jgi:cell division protein FtsQ
MPTGKNDEQVKRKILNIVGWVMVLSGIIVLLGFAEIQQGEALCQKLSISIEENKGHFFIDESDIRSFLRDRGDTLIGKPLRDINIGLLEKLLKNNPYIENAEVYSTIDGEVKIEITQRNPVIRIFNALNDSYSIDENGMYMPLCNKYTARVLIANGYIYDKERISPADSLKTDSITGVKAEIFRLAEFITADKFWNACIEQIYIAPDSQIELIPRIGNHRIILGDTSKMEEKFNKLLLFYKSKMGNTGWKNYSVVNLSYDNQIVCKLRESIDIVQ